MEPIQLILFFFAAFKEWHVPFSTLDNLSQLIFEKFERRYLRFKANPEY